MKCEYDLAWMMMLMIESVITIQIASVIVTVNASWSVSEFVTVFVTLTLNIQHVQVNAHLFDSVGDVDDFSAWLQYDWNSIVIVWILSLLVLFHSLVYENVK